MIRLTVIATGFALLSSASGAGSLDDPIVDIAPQSGAPSASSEDWSGFYVGGQFLVGDGFDGVADFDATGLGAHAGYLYDLGDVVVGGELEAIRSTTVLGSAPNTSSMKAMISTAAEWMLILTH